MKSSVKNINLKSVDDIFSTEEIRQDQNREKVIQIPLNELYPFHDHPFKVLDDDKMLDTVVSVKSYGVLIPAIARPREKGGYEIVAGHRRHRASELAELDTMPVLVRDLDDEEATIIMVDSNLQRESILPSERAFAFKMKMDAIKRQGERKDLTSSQVGTKLQRADEIIAEDAGTSRNQVQRYIRLTELVPEFMSMVDNKQMGMTPAVELSYLTEEQQALLVDVIDAEQSIPSLSQAQRIKQLSKDNNCSFDTVSTIMGEEKKSEVGKISIPTDKLKKYFPKSYTPQKIEESIMKILEGWHKKKQHSQER